MRGLWERERGEGRGEGGRGGEGRGGEGRSGGGAVLINTDISFFFFFFFFFLRGYASLTDFNIASSLQEKDYCSSFCGTPLYQAPETYRKEKYSYQGKGRERKREREREREREKREKESKKEERKL